MSQRNFSIIVFITALFLSGCAAYYSVFGLSKLFSGAATQVIIMATSLEVAKLVCASLLQRYWKDLDILKKSYLLVATLMLIIVTSAGIYGYLSSAYQITASKDTLLEKKLGVLEMKKSRYSDQVVELKSEQSKVTESISQLRNSLSTGSTNQYLDKKSGQVISTVSTSAQKTFSSQLDDAIKRRDIISAKIESANDSIVTYEIAIINEKSNSSVSSELGPLKYLSNVTGKSMDSVVGWFLLFIIFIFDPLAIILLTTANFLFFKKEIHQVVPVPEPVITPPVSVETNEPITWVQSSTNDFPVQDIISGSMFDSNIIQEEPSGDVISTDTDSFNSDPVITVPVVQSEIPVIEVTQVGKHKLIETDMNRNLADRIRKVLPWWNNDVSGSDSQDTDVSFIPDDELTERHKNNMTQEQIKDWYRKHKNSVS